MSEITVKELIDQLKIYNPDDIVCFGPSGHFSFYRTKNRTGVIQIEFNETEGVDYELLPEHPANKKP